MSRSRQFEQLYLTYCILSESCSLRKCYRKHFSRLLIHANKLDGHVIVSVEAQSLRLHRPTGSQVHFARRF